MPKARRAPTEIQELVESFAERLIGLVEATMNERVQSAIAAALDGTGQRRRGRPPKALAGLPAGPAPRARPRPRQLCPVPGCEGTAAPVFGMVCAEHKDVPKAKVKEYREARRQAKLEGASAPEHESTAN